MKFPKHKCGLYLEHNPHRNMYETIEVNLEHEDDDHWISPEQKAKALETQDFWSLQWYPDTPIGFYCLYAHDLGALLEAACKIKD